MTIFALALVALAQGTRPGEYKVPTEMVAHGDAGRAQRSYEREADRERMERKRKRCKYLAEISRHARADVLVEIMYERNRLGCGAFGY
jgi:hypothetical protein